MRYYETIFEVLWISGLETSLRNTTAEENFRKLGITEIFLFLSGHIFFYI